MKAKTEEKKGARTFLVAKDLIVYVPLYALLLLAIFAGISYLMVLGLDLVASEQTSLREMGGTIRPEALSSFDTLYWHA
ncbi:MAG: hypothetical protein ABEH38_01965 [Flavobacteriales bacterium]